MKKSTPLDGTENESKQVELNDETDPENGSLESRFDGQETESKDSSGIPATKNCTTKLPDFFSGDFDEPVDEDASSQSNDKKVRVRSVIPDDVLATLNMHFERNPKPNRDQINELSRELNLPQKVLKVWHQNRRAKVGDISGGHNELPLESIYTRCHLISDIKIEKTTKIQ